MKVYQCMSEINVNRNLFILCYNNFDFPVLTFNLSRFVCHVVCLMPTWVAPQQCFVMLWDYMHPMFGSFRKVFQPFVSGLFNIALGKKSYCLFLWYIYSHVIFNFEMHLIWKLSCISVIVHLKPFILFHGVNTHTYKLNIP